MHYCFRAGMYKQGLLHDLSKYAPVEFLVGCKYYQGDRSPNNAEREDTGISKSWLHHKGRNKHHFEYWVDYAPGDEHIINGLIDFSAWGANEAGESLRPWQSGDVRQYAVWFLTGAVALTLVLLSIL